ncbi:MAG: hypothetical protein JXR96_10250 [Deltaproteobacteria bacterium]|nr:hypothetical protein [Deltaproteobacteria bacterium]
MKAAFRIASIAAGFFLLHGLSPAELRADSFDSSSQNSSEESSENSSEESSDKSSRQSSEGSSEGSTKSKSDAAAMTVPGALIIVAATVVAGVWLSTETSEWSDAAEDRLGWYLRRHHAMVTCDIVLAGGPVLSDWAAELKLSRAELVRLRRALDGSAEQSEMLRVLDSDLEETDVKKFAACFFSVALRALGEERMGAVVRLVASPLG